MAPRNDKKGKPKKFKPTIKGSSLRRPKPFLTERISILIVCEDSKSSPDYFEKFRKQLRLSTVTVEICGKECGSAPISVVDFAKEKKLDVRTSTIHDDYDRIFCVVDVDNHTTLGDAVQKARDNGLELIISNPCFEYWYILHFEKTGRSYINRAKLYKNLEKHIGYKYEKSGCDFFDKVYEKTEIAIRNSKEMLSTQYHNKKDLRECNPSTHVHLIMECINDIATKAH